MSTPLQKIRKENNLTLQELAKDLGIDPSNLSRIERGMQSASPQFAEKVCNKFKGSISEIEILYPTRFSRAAA